MKERTHPGKIFLVYRILLVLVILIALLLFGGTIYAIVFHPEGRSPISGLKARTPPGQPAEEIPNDKMFPALGRLRITLADSSMLIVSPVFIYNSEDKAFTEELALRIRDLRELSREYFSPYKSEELLKKDEQSLKTDLLSLFNKTLRLGKIEVLYFNDFFIID